MQLVLVLLRDAERVERRAFPLQRAEEGDVLVDLARQGSAVLVISQDLDEIFEVADRIAVISRGELSEAYPASEMTSEKIGLLMAGAHELKETPHAARA